MPTISKEMVKLLQQHGFVKVRQAGSHIMIKNKNNNKQVTVPMHCKDLPKGTEQSILKQAGLK